MNTRSLVWKEIRERPWSIAATVAAVVFGVGSLVAIRHVTVFSEREVASQLEALGANILVLPKGTSLQDYYGADLNGDTLPEQHVSQILLASLPGVEKLAPKLCVPVEVGGTSVIVTGILPQSEFQAKAAWQTVSMFSKTKHVGCKKADACGAPTDTSPEALAKSRTIESLGPHDAVVGADAAARLQLAAGSSVVLLGDQFHVTAVLPATGTVDDGRIFAHLHTIQRCAKAGEVVNAIEVLGCCEDAAGDLVPRLSALLPDTKVVTISHVVETQVGVNRLMSRLSLFVLGVLVVVGGAMVASSTAANVRERRREIGTLMALGATPGLVARLFLMKAAWLGLGGGLIGCGLGIAAAFWLGPHWAGVRVAPLPLLACAAVLAVPVVTLAAAYLPARKAARLDPCACFQEV